MKQYKNSIVKGLKVKAIALALLVSTSAQACIFDGLFDDPFAESFPGSLNVALATQKALRSETIERVDMLEGTKALRRVSWWLTVLAKDKPDHFNEVSYVYMVDSQLWSKVNQDGSLAIHTGPAVDESPSAVLLLTENSLNALMTEKISLEKAKELGIVKLST